MGHTSIPLTNPGKALYPGSGFTKQQVMDYYIAVAPFLLPHLKDRPVTLKRYPDDVTGQSFYEKDATTFTPSWVQTYPVPRRAGGRPSTISSFNTSVTYQETQHFAHVTAQVLEQTLPRLIVSDMAKARNAAPKTTVAVYSLRASHDPPSVSVPVAWPELEQAIRKRRPESLEGLQIGRCPFANLPEPKNARRGLALTAEVMPSYRWLKSELVVQVEFAEWTPNGHLRHASFVGLREDKDPRLVVREKAVPSEE